MRGNTVAIQALSAHMGSRQRLEPPCHRRSTDDALAILPVANRMVVAACYAHEMIGVGAKT